MSIHCDNPHFVNETRVNGYNVIVMIGGMVALLFFSVLIGLAYFVETGGSVYTGLRYILLGNLVVDWLVYKKFSWIFRVLSWDQQGITLKNTITRSSVHIPWDEAFILSTKKGGYTIHGAKGKSIDIDSPLKMGNEQNASRFVFKKWRKVYSQSDREQVLYCTDDYKASITKDHLRINGKTLPLSRIQYIWKENMDDYGCPDYQSFILKIRDFDDLAVYVELTVVETFLQRLYDHDNSIKYFDCRVYIPAKIKKELDLAGEEKEFCARRHKYRIGYIEIGAVGGLFSTVFFFSEGDWVARLLGVEPGWTYVLYFLGVVLVSVAAKSVFDRVVNAYRRRGHVETL